MVKKKTILWLSDSPLINTGYSTISRNILNRLGDEYDCHFLAHNLLSQDIPPGLTLKDGTRFDFWIHGAGREQYCKDLIVPMINIIKPDIVVTLLDTFMVYPWFNDINFAPAKSVFYFPSDGGGAMPQNCESVLKHMNVSVAMAKFGQRQCKEVHNLDTMYIPHAVDTDIYRPLSSEEKQQTKQDLEVVSLLGNKMKGFLADKYVVGTVARNQGRKMLDRTIKSFALFCKDKPNAVLYMHCDPADNASVFDLRQLIVRYKLENRVCFSDIKYYKNFEYKDMRKVYNVMDAFFLTTSGEGFGIPTVEAMSCEVPVVVTDYTTTQELVMEEIQAGYVVPICAELTGSWSVERAIMDDNKAAEILTHLYNNPEEGKTLGKQGRKKVLKYYDWDVVMKDWKKLFDSLCE